MYFVEIFSLWGLLLTHLRFQMPWNCVSKWLGNAIPSDLETQPLVLGQPWSALVSSGQLWSALDCSGLLWTPLVASANREGPTKNMFVYVFLLIFGSIFGFLGQIWRFFVQKWSPSCSPGRDLQNSIVILSSGAVWTWNVENLSQSPNPHARNPPKSIGNL